MTPLWAKRADGGVGAKLIGTQSLEALEAGERKPFDVMLTDLSDDVTLVVSHPKGGTYELAVLRPRVAVRPSASMNPRR